MTASRSAYYLSTLPGIRCGQRRAVVAGLKPRLHSEL